MRLTIKALLLSSATFCASAAFAASLARVNVPFSFTVKGQSYPAGMYEVSMDSRSSFVTLASKDYPAKQSMWIVGPADPSNMAAVIKFDETGSDYALKTIQLGNKITPNLNSHPVHAISATTSIGGQ